MTDLDNPDNLMKEEGECSDEEVEVIEMKPGPKNDKRGKHASGAREEVSIALAGGRALPPQLAQAPKSRSPPLTSMQHSHRMQDVVKPQNDGDRPNWGQGFWHKLKAAGGRGFGKQLNIGQDKTVYDNFGRPRYPLELNRKAYKAQQASNVVDLTADVPSTSISSFTGVNKSAHASTMNWKGKRKKKKSKFSVIDENSTQSEGDFDNLLTEYKQIQKQLDDIKHEEEMVANKSMEPETVKERAETPIIDWSITKELRRSQSPVFDASPDLISSLDDKFASKARPVSIIQDTGNQDTDSAKILQDTKSQETHREPLKKLGLNLSRPIVPGESLQQTLPSKYSETLSKGLGNNIPSEIPEPSCVHKEEMTTGDKHMPGLDVFSDRLQSKGSVSIPGLDEFDHTNVVFNNAKTSDANKSPAAEIVIPGLGDLKEQSSTGEPAKNVVRSEERSDGDPNSDQLYGPVPPKDLVINAGRMSDNGQVSARSTVKVKLDGHMEHIYSAGYDSSSLPDEGLGDKQRDLPENEETETAEGKDEDLGAMPMSTPGSRSEGEIIEPDSEPEEEDIEILQLRLAALASAANRSTVKPAEKIKARDHSDHRHRSSSGESARGSKRRREREREREREAEIKRRRREVMRKHDLEERRRQERRREENKKREETRREEIRKRDEIRREEARRREDERRKEEVRRKDEDRRRREEQEARRHREEEERRRQEQDRTRTEYQKILTLDDPKEQAERFLEVSQNRRARSKASPVPGERRDAPNRDKRDKDGKKLDEKDNYEEVAMDIDSSESTPTHAIEVDAPSESTTIPQDLDYYIPTPKSTPYPPQLVDMSPLVTYIPGIGVEAYDPTQVTPVTKPEISSSDTQPAPPGTSPVPVYTPSILTENLLTGKTSLPPMTSVAPAPPPPPPPLPPEDLPPEEPPPPPSWNPEDIEADSEVCDLRKQLLMGMKTKKPASKEGETMERTVELLDRSLTASPAGSSPGQAGSSPGPPKPKKSKMSVPRQRQITQIPIHQPVVIKVGHGDSSDSEDEVKEERPAFSGMLDNFLKEARKAVDDSHGTVEPNSKKAPVKVKPTTSISSINSNATKTSVKAVSKEATPNKTVRLPKARTVKSASSKRPVTAPSQTARQINTVSSSMEAAKPVKDTQHVGSLQPLQRTVVNRVKPDVQANSLQIKLVSGSRDIRFSNSVGQTTDSKPGVKSDPKVSSRIVIQTTNKDKASPVKPPMKDVNMVGPLRVPLTTVREHSEKVTILHEKEAQLVSLRVKMNEDRAILTDLKSQSEKRKEVLKMAESKMQKLKEQMLATQRIMKANKEGLVKISQEAQGHQKSLRDNKELYGTLLNEIKAISYEQGTTRVENTMKSRPELSTAKSQGSTTAEKLSKEKDRLLQLEQKYKQKIEQYKQLQSQKTELDVEIIEMPPKEVKSEDIIIINDSGDDDDDAVTEPPRRRSLLDVGNSTIPELNSSHANNSVQSASNDNVDGSNNNKSTNRAVQMVPTATDYAAANIVVKVEKTDENNQSTSIKSSGSTSVTVSPEISIVPNKAEDNSSIKKQGGMHIQLSDGTVVQLPKQARIKRILRRRNCRNPWAFVVNIEEPMKTDSPSYDPGRFLEFQSQSDGDTFTPISISQSESKKEDGITQFEPYRSPLRVFRGYRFNPHFSSEEKLRLSSRTYIHNIDPFVPMCRFDMSGECNDKKCPWQHQRQYTVPTKVLYKSIIQYMDQKSKTDIIGICFNNSRDSNDNGKRYEQFYEKLHKENPGKSVNEICQILVDLVNHNRPIDPPHYMPIERRNVFRDNVYPEKKFNLSLVKPRNNKDIRRFDDLDNIITESDIRYWMGTSQDFPDMESAVIEAPNDVAMWLKLAYKKLYDASGANSIDQALNVMARALEHNSSNSDLWFHYLVLFSRKDDYNTFIDMCQQAVLYAPSYNIYWKYLESTLNLNKKTEICGEILEYLPRQLPAPSSDKLSHQMLEVILYPVSLLAQSGQIDVASKTLQVFLQRKTGPSSHLTQEDRVIGWLSYIHIKEFGCLPVSLFDPNNSNPGHIVNKNPFLFPWKPELNLNYEALSAMFSLAVMSCYNADQSQVEQNIKACLPIHRNRIQLDISAKKIDEAERRCRDLLQGPASKMSDLWLVLADIVSLKGDPGEEIRKVFEKGLLNNPCSVQLHLSCAKFYLFCQQDSDKALEQLEFCAIRMFQVDLTQSDVCDPNLLYCKLLDQCLPLNYTPPVYNDGVNQEVITNQQGLLWCCYCLLLELQGDWGGAVHAYNTAISKVIKTDHLKQIWKQYLSRLRLKLTTSLPSPEESHKFHDLFERCLVSVPCKVPVHFSTTYWLDYSFHNEIIDLYVSSLPEESHNDHYERFMRRMPKNVSLHLKASAALGTIELAVEDSPSCSTLISRLCSKMLKSDRQIGHDEIKKILQSAVVNLSYFATYWAQLLKCEVTVRNSQNVKKIFERCKELGIPFDGLVKAVTPQPD